MLGGRTGAEGRRQGNPRQCKALRAGNSPRLPRTDVAVVVDCHPADIHVDAVALVGAGPEGLLLPRQRVVQQEGEPTGGSALSGSLLHLLLLLGSRCRCS